MNAGQLLSSTVVQAGGSDASAVRTSVAESAGVLAADQGEFAGILQALSREKAPVAVAMAANQLPQAVQTVQDTVVQCAAVTVQASSAESTVPSNFRVSGALAVARQQPAVSVPVPGESQAVQQGSLIGNIELQRQQAGPVTLKNDRMEAARSETRADDVQQEAVQQVPQEQDVSLVSALAVQVVLQQGGHQAIPAVPMNGPETVQNVSQDVNEQNVHTIQGPDSAPHTRADSVLDVSGVSGQETCYGKSGTTLRQNPVDAPMMAEADQPVNMARKQAMPEMAAVKQSADQPAESGKSAVTTVLNGEHVVSDVLREQSDGAAAATIRPQAAGRQTDAAMLQANQAIAEQHPLQPEDLPERSLGTIPARVQEQQPAQYLQDARGSVQAEKTVDIRQHVETKHNVVHMDIVSQARTVEDRGLNSGQEQTVVPGTAAMAPTAVKLDMLDVVVGQKPVTLSSAAPQAAPAKVIRMMPPHATLQVAVSPATGSVGQEPAPAEQIRNGVQPDAAVPRTRVASREELPAAVADRVARSEIVAVNGVLRQLKGPLTEPTADSGTASVAPGSRPLENGAVLQAAAVTQAPDALRAADVPPVRPHGNGADTAPALRAVESAAAERQVPRGHSTSPDILEEVVSREVPQAGVMVADVQPGAGRLLSKRPVAQVTPADAGRTEAEFSAPAAPAVDAMPDQKAVPALSEAEKLFPAEQAAAESAQPTDRQAASVVHHQDVRMTRVVTTPAEAAPAEVVRPEAQQVVRQVRDQLVQHDLKNGTEQMVLRLSPENLGELKLNFNLQGQRLSVEIVTERHDVRDAIMKHVDVLKESLSRQNISMESFDVSTNSRGGDSRSGQGQSDWRQMAREQQQFAWLNSGGYRVQQVQETAGLPSYHRPASDAMVDIHY